MPWMRRSSEAMKFASDVLGKCEISEDFDDNRSSCSDESVCYYIYTFFFNFTFLELNKICVIKKMEEIN